MRVYVETNFVIDLLRPFPKEGATELFARHRNGELTLLVPWCSIKEAQRTLERVIRTDLGFDDVAGKAWAQIFRTNPDVWRARGASVQKYIEEVRRLSAEAWDTSEDRLANFAKQVHVIPPSERAIDFTLKLKRKKELKPFDEAILGCVLADAEMSRAIDSNRYFFCNLDKDLRPTADNGLQAEYEEVGLTHLSNFEVP